MAKFKVDDNVIAKKYAPYVFTTNGWKGVVTDSYGNTICVEALTGGAVFHVNPQFFDLDTSCNQKIVITSNGKTTLARLYQNNSVVKTAKAKCSPEDIFDFKTGANLAYSRLMGLEHITAEEKPSFKEGDRVRITANTNEHNFKIGSVVTIISDKADCANQWRCKGMDNYGRVDCWYVRESDMVKVKGLDWEAFKAGKIAVKVTKDNFEKFVAEAKKHKCTFCDEGFNPFDDIYHLFYCALFAPNTENELYIMYEHGNLKAQHKLFGLEEFVW